MLDYFGQRQGHIQEKKMPRPCKINKLRAWQSFSPAYALLSFICSLIVKSDLRKG